MCSPAYERRGDMRRKDIEKYIRQKNRIAECEAELNRIKAQLCRRISAFMSGFHLLRLIGFGFAAFRSAP